MDLIFLGDFIVALKEVPKITLNPSLIIVTRMFIKSIKIFIFDLCVHNTKTDDVNQ